MTVDDPQRGPLDRWRAGELDGRAGALEAADSVEVKLLLDPDADVAATLVGTSRRAPRHALYLLDTVDAALARQGVVLRVRRLPGGRCDVVVKARRPAGAEAPPAPPSGDGRCRVELDVLPGAAMWAAELRRRVDPRQVDACLAGAAPPGTLLSEPQRDFAASALSDGSGDIAMTAPATTGPATTGLATTGLATTGLRVHGPLVVERLSIPPRRVGMSRARLEQCRYPNGARLTEFSVRCRPDVAGEVAARAVAFLDQHQVRAARHQQTKIDQWIDLIEREVAPAGSLVPRPR